MICPFSRNDAHADDYPRATLPHDIISKDMQERIYRGEMTMSREIIPHISAEAS